MAIIKYLDSNGEYQAINLVGTSAFEARLISNYRAEGSNLIFLNSNGDVLFTVDISTFSDVLLNDNILLIENPKEAQSDAGFQVQFKVVAIGKNLQYQWQTRYSLGDNTGWTDVDEPTAITNTLTFVAQADQHRYEYRCRITDNNGKVLYSDSAPLIITGSYDMNIWGDVQRCIRDGKIANYVTTDGTTEFTFKRGDTEYSLIPIGINEDTPADPNYTNSLTLKLKTTVGIKMTMDAAEALYYCENGLPAGDYYVKTGDEAFSSFTTTVDIPAGGQLVGTSWSTVAVEGYDNCVKILSSYSDSTSTSVLESNIVVTFSVEEPVTRTNLGITNNIYNPYAKNAAYPNLNNAYRARYGSNDLFESGIYQWIKTDADAGTYWQSTNKFDRPWNERIYDGWLKGISEDLTSVIGTVKKITECNTIIDTTKYGADYRETEEDWFLLSLQELNAGIQNGVVTNNKLNSYGYSFYKNESSNGSDPTISSDANRIIYSPSGIAQFYFSRSPFLGSCGQYKHCNAEGYVGSSYASNTHEICLACCIW